MCQNNPDPKGWGCAHVVWDPSRWVTCCRRMVDAAKARADSEDHRLAALKLQESSKQDSLQAELIEKKKELKRYAAKVSPSSSPLPQTPTSSIPPFFAPVPPQPCECLLSALLPRPAPSSSPPSFPPSLTSSLTPSLPPIIMIPLSSPPSTSPPHPCTLLPALLTHPPQASQAEKAAKDAVARVSSIQAKRESEKDNSDKDGKKADEASGDVEKLQVAAPRPRTLGMAAWGVGVVPECVFWSGCLFGRLAFARNPVPTTKSC